MIGRPGRPAGRSVRRVAAAGVAVIGRAFDRYRLEFTTITARAPDRFARREWREVHEDATLRLDLYRRSIDRLEEEIADELGARVRDRAVWVEMKRLYSAGSTERADRELAETFFNSITRRLFSTVGVDSQCEFVARQVEPQEPSGGARDAAGFDGDLHRVVGRVLDTGLGVVWEDRERDVGLVVDRVRPLLEGDREIRVEMSPHPFYRGAGAYLVGRVESRSRPGFPLVLAVRNGSAGAWVDAVLLEERDVSILFSYTFLLPRSRRAARPARRLSQANHPQEADRRAVHRDRLRQARQDRVVPRPHRPPGVHRRRLRANAGHAGDGHGLVRASLAGSRTQGDP